MTKIGQHIMTLYMCCSYYTYDNTAAVTFPPPRQIYLDSIGPNAILFSWSVVEHEGCPIFHYNVDTANCGTCYPSTTTSNTSNCTNFRDVTVSNVNNMCNFTVQSVICGNITGNMSYILVNLKGNNTISCIIIIMCLSPSSPSYYNIVAVPDAPVVQSVPHYSFRTASLTKLATSFQVVVSIMPCPLQALQ